MAAFLEAREARNRKKREDFERMFSSSDNNSNNNTGSRDGTASEKNKPKKNYTGMRSIEYSHNSNHSKSLRYHLRRFTGHRTDFYKKRRAFQAVYVQPLVGTCT